MEKTLMDLYQKGTAAFNERRYDEARENFNQLVEEGGQFADVFNMTGVIAFVQNDYEKAKDNFRRALEINPNYTEASLNLSIALNDTGEYPAGEKAFIKASKAASAEGGSVDPFIKGRIANLHFELAEIYHGLGLYDDALKEYLTATKLRAAFPDVRTRLGVLYRDMGQHDDAVVEFNKVLEENPGYNPAQVQLGISWYGQGEIEQAIASWRAVLARDPDDAKANMYIRLAEKGLG